MIEKLKLPFPLLSDPDRSQVIEPYGVADRNDPREIARPGVVVVGPDGDEAYRQVSRDFADRMPEEEVVEVVESLELDPVTQPPPEMGPAEAGPRAMPLQALGPYYRGAKFATKALAMRVPEAAGEAERYEKQLDRFAEGVKKLRT